MATTEIRRTACSLDCFDACGIVAEVADGRIARLGGDPDHPFTRGALCKRSITTCAIASTIPTASFTPCAKSMAAGNGSGGTRCST
jgi:hypothetical protein